MSELANKSAQYKATITGGTITASLSAVSQPSQDVLAPEGQGVFFDKITVQVASGASVVLSSPPPSATSPNGTLAASATVDISGTATNITSNGKPAVQKGDSGNKVITFTFPGPNGSTVPYGVNVKVEVDNPGQTDVIAL